MCLNKCKKKSHQTAVRTVRGKSWMFGLLRVHELQMPCRKWRNGTVTFCLWQKNVDSWPESIMVQLPKTENKAASRMDSWRRVRNAKMKSDICPFCSFRAQPSTGNERIIHFTSRNQPEQCCHVSSVHAKFKYIISIPLGLMQTCQKQLLPELWLLFLFVFHF